MNILSNVAVFFLPGVTFVNNGSPRLIESAAMQVKDEVQIAPERVKDLKVIHLLQRSHAY